MLCYFNHESNTARNRINHTNQIRARGLELERRMDNINNLLGNHFSDPNILVNENNETKV